MIKEIKSLNYLEHDEKVLLKPLNFVSYKNDAHGLGHDFPLAAAC